MSSGEKGNALERIFHLKENHTTVKTEVVAGITTFMTMAYILAVNPNILGETGMDSGAVFTATALAALIATLLMAAFSNYPFVLAPGMGLNALPIRLSCRWDIAGRWLWRLYLQKVLFLSYYHSLMSGRLSLMQFL